MKAAAGQRSAFEPGRSAAKPPALRFLNARTPDRRGHSKLAVSKWDEPSEREAQHSTDEVMDSIHTERDAASPVTELSANRSVRYQPAVAHAADTAAVPAPSVQRKLRYKGALTAERRVVPLTVAQVRVELRRHSMKRCVHPDSRSQREHGR